MALFLFITGFIFLIFNYYFIRRKDFKEKSLKILDHIRKHETEIIEAVETDNIEKVDELPFFKEKGLICYIAKEENDGTISVKITGSSSRRFMDASNYRNIPRKAKANNGYYLKVSFDTAFIYYPIERGDSAFSFTVEIN
ncbi:MAG: hypothetical protein LUD76_07155 [Alistipes sp.]|nr:hypothetical protein [Alistipes sp.]